MLTSQFITKLVKLIAEHGDVPIYTDVEGALIPLTEDDGEFQEADFNFVNDEQVPSRIVI